MQVTEHAEKVRTTVRMPKPLYDEARKFVNGNSYPAGTINDFFVAAVCAYVKLLHRKQIDAAFGAMAHDSDYQKQAQLIAEEFTQSDWEALETIDREQETLR
jgi:hypothetical protein